MGGVLLQSSVLMRKAIVGQLCGQCCVGGGLLFSFC